MKDNKCPGVLSVDILFSNLSQKTFVPFAKAYEKVSSITTEHLFSFTWNVLVRCNLHRFALYTWMLHKQVIIKLFLNEVITYCNTDVIIDVLFPMERKPQSE